MLSPIFGIRWRNAVAEWSRCLTLKLTVVCLNPEAGFQHIDNAAAFSKLLKFFTAASLT